LQACIQQARSEQHPGLSTETEDAKIVSEDGEMWFVWHVNREERRLFPIHTNFAFRQQIWEDMASTLK
jgi:hypothetical protein